MQLSDADIKKYIPLQTTGTSAKLEGFETRSLYKYFPKYIGQPMVDTINSGNAPAELIGKVTPAWVVLTYLESIPFLDVVSTNTGFGVVRSNTIAPASAERVEKLRLALESAGNDYMDILLLYLEQNSATYQEWNKSSLNEGSLIPDVTVFDQFVDINISRSKFIELKRIVNQWEITAFTNQFSAEFLSELQAGNDTVVKPLIQRALTFFAMAEFERANNQDAPVQSLVKNGEDALNRAKSYLVNHLDEYLTYSTYGYEAPYDNEIDGEESGFFIAGGPA